MQVSQLRLTHFVKCVLVLEGSNVEIFEEALVVAQLDEVAEVFVVVTVLDPLDTTLEDLATAELITDALLL